MAQPTKGRGSGRLYGPYVTLFPEEKEYLKEKLAGDEHPCAVEILRRIEHTEDEAMVKMRIPHK